MCNGVDKNAPIWSTMPVLLGEGDVSNSPDATALGVRCFSDKYFKEVHHINNKCGGLTLCSTHAS